jgi:hypothetical protein
MMRRLVRFAAGGAVAGAVATAVVALMACADRPAVPPLAVRDAWARRADSAATTAAYFVIVNHDTTTVALTAASSPMAESATLHESMQMNNMVHMTPLDGPQRIAPGDSLVLNEGAKHLMVTGLKRALAAGDSLPILLNFSDGRVLHVSAVVRAP